MVDQTEPDTCRANPRIQPAGRDDGLTSGAREVSDDGIA